MSIFPPNRPQHAAWLLVLRPAFEWTQRMSLFGLRRPCLLWGCDFGPGEHEHDEDVWRPGCREFDSCHTGSFRLAAQGGPHQGGLHKVSSILWFIEWIIITNWLDIINTLSFRHCAIFSFLCLSSLMLLLWMLCVSHLNVSFTFFLLWLLTLFSLCCEMSLTSLALHVSVRSYCQRPLLKGRKVFAKHFSKRLRDEEGNVLQRVSILEQVK